MNIGTVLVCSSATTTPEVRAVVGAFVKELRHVDPAIEWRDVPIDHLAECRVTQEPRVAIPLTLTGHGAVANALAEAQTADSGLLVGPALGPDWALAEVAVRRLVDVGAHHGDTIVMGVAGSEDAAEIADYSRAAQLLSAVWGGPVHVGSLGGMDTPIADAMDIARAHGRKVIISPYVLTPGKTAEALRGVGADRVAGPILDGASPDRSLLNAVLQRCRDASAAAPTRV